MAGSGIRRRCGTRLLRSRSGGVNTIAWNRAKRTPARLETASCCRSRADRLDAVYLRAAQAYMLISMPTGTSTTFGVFQVIASLQVVWREVRTGVERRATPDAAQVRRMKAISLLDNVSSLLDKVARDKGTRGAEVLALNNILNGCCSGFGLPASTACGTLRFNPMSRFNNANDERGY